MILKFLHKAIPIPGGVSADGGGSSGEEGDAMGGEEEVEPRCRLGGEGRRRDGEVRRWQQQLVEGRV